ncbi:porin [Candidatus Pelagibacter sp.]|nr:porin [Candidatus Pelagibacter sp.]
MINLRKLGFTALAGSLAAVSAQAGEMSVTGSHITTYTTGDNGVVENAHSAQALGSNTNLNFSGSGELDNGWTVSTFVLMNDATSGLSSSAATVTMGDMGTLGISKVGGFNVNGAYDETYPRAYEENSDAGGQSSLNSVGNWADDNAIIYKAPAIDLMGATINVGIEHSLQAGTATGGDGAGAARSDTYGNGTALGVTAAYGGLTLGAYGAERENKNPGKVDDVQDEFNGSMFVNYNFGPVSIGYQETYFDSGVTHNATTSPLTTTAVKTVGAAGGIFTGEAMSIAFNVNDNLSISYAEVEDTYDAQSNVKGGTESADVVQKTESLQVAYSMGSMSIKAYSTETTNPNYDSDAKKLNVNEIALGLAF